MIIKYELNKLKGSFKFIFMKNRMQNELLNNKFINNSQDEIINTTKEFMTLIQYFELLNMSFL